MKRDQSQIDESVTSFDHVSMKVDGRTVIADNDEMAITDINEDMDNVASQMSYWGAVWAAAEKELVAADSYYRNWRAKLGKVISDKDGKAAEWKVRQDIEASKEFYSIKTAISNATLNVILSKTRYEALRTKASILQSKGAMMRAELDSTSMRTPMNSKRGAEQEEKREAAKIAMKEIFKGKKNN